MTFDFVSSEHVKFERDNYVLFIRVLFLLFIQIHTMCNLYKSIIYFA